MSKRTVTWLFVGATIAFVAGILVVLIATVMALASGAVSIGGTDVVAVDGSKLTEMLLWMALAAVLIGGATVLAIVSWIGALFNTVNLEDKTWFVLLLVLGLASFGWVAMIAYVIAGPDGTRPTPAGAQMITQTEARG